MRLCVVDARFPDSSRIVSAPFSIGRGRAHFNVVHPGGRNVGQHAVAANFAGREHPLERLRMPAQPRPLLAGAHHGPRLPDGDVLEEGENPAMRSKRRNVSRICSTDSTLKLLSGRPEMSRS